MRFPWHIWIKLWINRLCLGVSYAHATYSCSVVSEVGRFILIFAWAMCVVLSVQLFCVIS